MTTRDLLWTSFGLGFGAGAATIVAVVYLPVRAWARSAADNRQEIARLMRPIRAQMRPIRAQAQADLTDGRGAYLEASTAYLPVYPGNSGRWDDPDPAWLAWLHDGGADYWSRPRAMRPSTAVLVSVVTMLWLLGHSKTLQWVVRVGDTARARLSTLGAPAVAHRAKRQYRWSGSS